MIKSHQSSLLRRLFFPKREIPLKISPNNLLVTTKINKNKKNLKKKSVL